MLENRKEPTLNEILAEYGLKPLCPVCGNTNPTCGFVVSQYQERKRQREKLQRN